MLGFPTLRGSKYALSIPSSIREISNSLSVYTLKQMPVVSAGGGLGNPKLLEKIDKLFELNIGQYVDLSQVIYSHNLLLFHFC